MELIKSMDDFHKSYQGNIEETKNERYLVEKLHSIEEYLKMIRSVGSKLILENNNFLTF